MEGAIRDLDQLREGVDPASGRKAALFGLAALCAIALVLGLLSSAGSASGEESPPFDPLSDAQGFSPSRRAGEPTGEEPPTNPLSLSFPSTLSGERADVAMALAAARAELRHPDPIGIDRRPTLSQPLIPAADAAEIALPAGVAAASRSRTSARDPLLAAHTGVPSVQGERAPEGHDGEFTVQVISYDTAEGAHAFAAGLRARGHRAFVMRADIEGRGTVYRVRIGPFESMADASRYRREFEATERMNTIVIRRR